MQGDTSRFPQAIAKAPSPPLWVCPSANSFGCGRIHPGSFVSCRQANPTCHHPHNTTHHTMQHNMHASKRCHVAQTRLKMNIRRRWWANPACHYPHNTTHHTTPCSTPHTTHNTHHTTQHNVPRCSTTCLLRAVTNLRIT